MNERTPVFLKQAMVGFESRFKSDQTTIVVSLAEGECLVSREEWIPTKLNSHVTKAGNLGLAI